jgi:hypothetical protein
MISNESYIFLAVLTALALVALLYLLSPMSLLDDVTARGTEIRTKLREFLRRHDYTTDTRTVLVIGGLDTALEHHEAIWLLHERKLNGSAFAMIRLVFDAMFRALWLRAVATDEQVEQAATDDLEWRGIPVRDDIKRVYFGTPDNLVRAARLDELFQSLGKAWKILCSYTHSGARQLTRRFTFDEVKPNYTEHELAQAMSAATEILLLGSALFFGSVGLEQEAEDTATMRNQYKTDFDERLHTGQ